ncbi:MAG: transcriptional regulator [Pseudomonadota bacterium]
MPLTKKFKETIVARAKHDMEFRQAILISAINELLSGDLNVAKSMLRDYINATISFEPLAKKLHKNSKSLQRMLSTNGNPTSQSLFDIIKFIQLQENIKLEVHTRSIH